ncbi:MAG: hypothetical protein P1U61_04990 [Legionellaceae bacterium]|nr:hypothetical protein [Legionellaceae bacterium]
MSKLKMVNLSDELIDQYCTKYKLTRARYDEEKALLEQKKNQEGQQAYSEEQINRLILKVSSKKTVSSVLSLHAELIGEGLTPVDIFKIAAHGGGSKNLLAYIEQTEALREQGLSWQSLNLEVADVIRLLSHHGGSKKLKALMYLMALPHEQK